MLADVAQELQDRLRAGPVEVVRDHGTGRRAVELDEPLQLAADALHPVGDRVRALQRALPHVARIADLPGRAAGEDDRPGARLLEAAQGEQRDEVPGVQARRRSGRIRSTA